jgi:hypothetical protein
VATAQTADPERALAEAIGEFIDDPLGFVRFAYHWGEGNLEGKDGPDAWQSSVLQYIGKNSLNAEEAIRVAVASGHGIGKTALVAWIIHWFASTRPNCAGVVTANTKDQLTKKTWRELALWHGRSLHKHWFEWSATKFAYVHAPDTWFISAVPWSEHNSEAFAGLHADYVLVLFDEASAIADVIWEVAEGAMTTPGAIWCAFGNPTKNTGRFKECFGRFRHRWHTMQIDSRDAKMANRAQIDQWIKDYGEDHDFVKVRVRGEFPSASVTQFIPMAMVEDAVSRYALSHEALKSPRVLGVDVARFGDDQSVILLREGTRVSIIRRYRNMALDTFANHVAASINEFKPDAVFIDEAGIGAGVVDILRGNKFRVTGVQGAAKPLDPKKYANLRAHCWGEMREWLAVHGAIPDDRELFDDLIGLEYGYNKHGALQLEKKDDMKRRGLASPDVADALALTFAHPVASDAAREVLERRHTAGRMQAYANMGRENKRRGPRSRR